MKDCPCKAKKIYSNCCGPLHRGATALSATSLMRSRYCAYALGLIDYIIETTHSCHPDHKLNAGARKQSLDTFCKATTFIDLIIHEHSNHGEFETVTFTATLLQNGNDASFTEKSVFKKELGKLKYFSGEMIERG